MSVLFYKISSNNETGRNNWVTVCDCHLGKNYSRISLDFLLTNLRSHSLAPCFIATILGAFPKVIALIWVNMMLFLVCKLAFFFILTAGGNKQACILLYYNIWGHIQACILLYTNKGQYASMHSALSLQGTICKFAFFFILTRGNNFFYCKLAFFFILTRGNIQACFLLYPNS